MRRVGVSTVVAAALIVPLLILLPPDVFWITDEGTKFIALQSLDRTGSVRIDYPGRVLDPAMRLLPDGGHHLIRTPRGVLALFLPWFQFLTLLPYRIAGTHGLYLVPAIGTLLTIAATAWMAGKNGAYAGLIVLIATPVLFYTFTYWEHTIALGLSTLAMALLTKKDWRAAAAAGALLATSSLLREEGYLLTAAVSMALLVRDRSIRPALETAAGFAAVITPAWLWHLQLYGSPLGLHSTVYASYSGSASLVRTAYDLLLRFGRDWRVGVLVAVPMLLALVLPRRFSRWVLLAQACAGALAVAVLLRSADPVFDTAFYSGLLPALPFLVLVFLDWREAGRFHMLIAVLFIAGACLRLNTSGTWIIWGPRHFLPIMPLLVLMAWEAWKRLDRPRLALLVIACGVAMQSYGVYVLWIKKDATMQIKNALVASGGGVVITDVFWLPQEMSSLFYDRIFLLTKTDADLRYALEACRRAGVREFTFVASRRYRRLSNHALAPILSAAQKKIHVAPRRVPFMETMILRVPTSSLSPEP